MRAALYIRVSTDMQAEEGFSIEGQRTRLISFAKSQDWEIADVYVDEGYSAKDLKRPAMQQMLQDMAAEKFDVVLVYKLDRLTRSVFDLHGLLNKFDAHSVKFKSATEVFETTTAMGRFFITLVGAMASWERETIAERVRFGIEQMVVEGKRPGGVLPYGYDSNNNLVPEEATLIRRIRDLYMKGDGYKAIAMRFNGEGLLRRGSEWTQATVAYTLENPYYAGIIRLGSKTSEGIYVNSNRDDRVNCLYGEGSHEAIFSTEEYEEHKAFMKRKSHQGFSRQKTYWFSGVLRCGRCGSAMFGRLTNKRNLKSGEVVRTPYYICSKKHASGGCDMPTFRQIHVEHLLMEYIEKAKSDHEAVKQESQELVKNVDSIVNESDRLKRELGKISERKRKWQYMFVEGLITQDEIRTKIQEENDNEYHIQQELATMQKMSSAVPKINQLLELADLWHVVEDDEDKKAIIYDLFERITLETNLTNVKGVKNKFFDAYLGEVLFT